MQTDTSIQTIQPTIDLAAKMQELQQLYPAYHRAWKSMLSTYGTVQIASEWRGTIGLMRFIEDTSTLPDNPDVYPDVAVKLKRKFPALMFELSNVYWKIPSKYKKLHLASPPASPVPKIQPASLSRFEAMTPQELEQQLDTLINLQMGGNTLSPIQQQELDILAALTSGTAIRDLEPVQKLSKFEDI